MPDRTEAAALIALLRAGERPWAECAGLVEEAGSAVAVLEGERATAPLVLFGEEPATGLEEITAEIDAWEAAGMRLFTVLDSGYPENLRAVHDRPPFVFVAGALTPSDARAIAVVGARVASPQGVRAAGVIAEHLVDQDFTVVSGLATGIDHAAHTAALARGGRTVAVIGTGLRRSYPSQHSDLQRRIAVQCAVISQFWPDAPPSRRSFPMRNAAMSGLSLATVVVEASVTSGSRIQARRALEHGRPVFLLESLLEQPWAREFAARPGARVIRSPEEITTFIERLTSPGALVA
ncbi:MAG TPA: DNA-processing protein DprA [Solirubrobacteraceae bacterium]|jgi:DNA processing protein|nr:DNA-processing protein DprA [Solirubrobacteraceae bacterium]